MPRETPSPDAIHSAVDTLMAGIEESEFGLFYGQRPLPQGWKPVGRIVNYKFKARNPNMGIFVKAYAPRTDPYAETAFRALLDLSKLRLSIPVLPPLMLYKNALVFPLGRDIERIRLEDKLSREEIAGIDAVVREFGLESLSSLDFGYVKYAGKLFIVDPFDDNIT